MKGLSKSYNGAKQEQPGGKIRREPHPNGGEVARVDVPRSKMPQNQSAAPIHHTPLNTDLGKMPKQMSGPRERDPKRR
jgi:hypothetical protein